MTKFYMQWSDLQDYDCYHLIEEHKDDGEFIGFDAIYFNPINNKRACWQRFRGLWRSCQECPDKAEVPIRDLNSIEYLDYLEDKISRRTFAIWYNNKYAMDDYVNIDSAFEEKIIRRINTLRCRLSKQQIKAKFTDRVIPAAD